MRFRIGSTFAKCNACKSEDFFPATPWSGKRRDVYICLGCRNQVALAELVSRPAGEPSERRD